MEDAIVLTVNVLTNFYTSLMHTCMLKLIYAVKVLSAAQIEQHLKSREMIKDHNIYYSICAKNEMLQFSRVLELFHLFQLQKPCVVLNGMYCDI